MRIYKGVRGNFPGGSEFKESACNAETQGRSLGWEDPLEAGTAARSSIFCLENAMDGGSW